MADAARIDLSLRLIWNGSSRDAQPADRMAMDAAAMDSAFFICLKTYPS